jgi:hypothetical protein
MKKDNKILYVPSGDRRFNWRYRHNATWYYKLKPHLRNLYDYMIDMADTGGVFNTSLLLQFNHMLFDDGLNSSDKWLKEAEILEQINYYRDIVRDLGGGYWFLEDYKCILDNSTNHLNVNVHKTGYAGGFIKSWLAHDIAPTSVRGIKTFTGESLSEVSMNSLETPDNDETIHSNS